MRKLKPVFLSLTSKIKDNKNASEIIKTVNMLVSSMNSEYLWEYMTRRFCTSLRWAGRLPHCLMLPLRESESSRKQILTVVNSLSLL